MLNFFLYFQSDLQKLKAYTNNFQLASGYEF